MIENIPLSVVARPSRHRKKKDQLDLINSMCAFHVYPEPSEQLMCDNSVLIN